MRIRNVAGLCVALAGCTTPSKPEYRASEVIERMGSADETPDWTTVAEPMFADGADVVFVSSQTMSGNARPEACVKAAELGAKADLLRHVKDNITTSGQVVEVGASADPGYESLTAFLSQGSISGASTKSRYWERVEESDESGERILRVKCAVKVAVKKSELARQMREATGSGGNAKVRESLLKAQKDFIEGLGSQSASAH
jgi:hypothetical protein